MATTDEADEQALQFVQWHLKRQGNVENDFMVWSRSKDLEQLGRRSHPGRRPKVAARAQPSVTAGHLKTVG